MKPIIIENFISKKTANSIHEYLKPKAIEHAPDASHPKGIKHITVNPTNSDVWAGVPSDNPVMVDIISLITESVAAKFNLKKDEINLKLIRYTLLNKGQSLSYHDDFQVSGYHVYSAVLYLNDEYEGGEILFYEYGPEGINPNIHPETYQEYKLQAGSLVYFNGDLGTPHEVKEVLSGERANFVFFYEGVIEKEGRF